MEMLVANLKTGRVRRETLHGKSYLVGSATLIVPGVLAGSEGGLYYPPDETANSAPDWNSIPIVVYHPTTTDPKTGKVLNISASTPGVLAQRGVGFLKKSQFRGKLKAEAWFDEARTKAVDPRVHKALLSNKPMELSTGLFVDHEPVAPGTTHNGKAYRSIARNYVPDHLAVLPDQVGACSLNDGCGVLVNAAELHDERDAIAQRLVAASHGWLPLNALPETPMFTTNCAGKPSCDCGCPSESWTPLDNATSLPSDSMDMTPEKACKIMKDGTVHGQKLTKKQRGMFGAICGEKKAVSNQLVFNTAPVSAPVWMELNCGGEGGTMGPCPTGDEGGKSKKRYDVHYIDKGGYKRKVKVDAASPEEAVELVKRKKRGITGPSSTPRAVEEGEEYPPRKKRPTGNCGGMSDMAYSPMSYGSGDDGSLGSLMSRVSSAFRAAHPTKYDPDNGHSLNYASLVSVFDDYVIFQESAAPGEPAALYRESFTVSPAGEVAFDGDAEKVNRVVRYEPLTNTVWEPIDNCGGEGGTKGPCPTGRKDRSGAGKRQKKHRDKEKKSQKHVPDDGSEFEATTRGGNKGKFRELSGSARLNKSKKRWVLGGDGKMSIAPNSFSIGPNQRVFRRTDT